MQQKSARPERTASRMLGRTPRRPDSTRCSASLPSAHGGPPRVPRLAATTTRPRGTITHEERGLQDLWNRKLPLIAEGDAWAPNRDTGQIPLGWAVENQATAGKGLPSDFVSPFDSLASETDAATA